MSYWTIAWIVWIAAFFVIETPALFNERKDETLSQKIWNWFSVRRKGRAWRTRRGLLGVFLLWLSIHFLTGGII